MANQFQKWKIGLVIILFIFSWDLYAKPLDSELSLSSRYSSNAFRNDTNKISDIENRVQFKFNKILTEGSLDSFIRGYSRYNYHQRKNITNRVSSNISTYANYHFSPDRFSWFIDDRLSDVLINSSLANIPGNRQRKNIFRSGPRYTFPFSRSSRLVTSLEYIDTQYQTLGGGSTRYRLGNQFEHNINAYNTLRLGLDLTRISFSARPNTTGKSLNVTYIRNKERNSIIAETGYTQYVTDKSNLLSSSYSERTGFITWRFSWNRQINELSKFNLEFQRVLTDTSSDTLLFLNNVNFNYTKSNKVKITSLKVQYDINLRAGKKLSIFLLSSKKQYVNSFSEDRSSEASARFNFPVSTFLSATTRIRYQMSKFAFARQKSKLMGVTFNLIYKITRQLHIQFDNGYDKQTSNISIRQYHNWYSYLGINYSF